MLSIVNSPYPLYNLNLRRLLAIIGIGAFVSFFLFYFQPFGTDQANFPNKNAFLLGYGPVISGALLLFEFIAIKVFFRNLKEENWTVGKQILWILIYTSCALVACYLYKQWFFNYPIRAKDFLYFYKIAFTVALFPIIIVILVDYIYQLKKNQTAATKINDQVSQTIEREVTIETKRIQLTAENGKDQFELALQDLRYIQSADNYAEVVYFKDKQTKKEILRNSLQRLEKQIQAQTQQTTILRCHRSFLVNLDQVKSVSGNAQGYKLHLENSELPIPISRSKSKEVLEMIKGRN